jgi:protein arginine kinase
VTKRYIEKGLQSDVVLSCRVRLARNFADYPFPSRLGREQSMEIVDKVKAAIKDNKESSKEFLYVDMHELDPISKQALVEKHLISPNLAESTIESGAAISKDERVSIMVNEEDHLRIQCIFPGMQIEKAWDMCNRIDGIFEKKISYAFDKDYGYLTCCPTNVGTGMRASVMLHLPALTITGYIRSVLETCSKLGVAVRGAYGEHSEASGNMFQFSNQISLGNTEKDILSGINNIVTQIIERERVLRKQLYEKNQTGFEDRLYRSFGVLQNARIISTEESVKLLSDVRLAVNMGIINETSLEVINEVMLIIQPASLQKIMGKPLGPQERDIKRAEIIRNKLASKGV